MRYVCERVLKSRFYAIQSWNQFDYAHKACVVAILLSHKCGTMSDTNVSMYIGAGAHHQCIHQNQKGWESEVGALIRAPINV